MTRGRFAPSPTGDLHLGGARTALLAWLSARSSGGAFVVRIEDLDRPRAVAGAEEHILQDLAWLGLDWDEGPDRDGAFGPYRQSERQARYQAALDRLLADGRAFSCFCSRAEVERAAQAPHGPSDDGPRYPGTCRALGAQEIAARSKSRAPSVRLRVDPETIEWTDGLHGARSDSVHDTVGDFVLRRADGIFAYQLAVVVDDAEMGITEVVRGDDLLGSTARQLLLYRALGLSAPRFVHVPLVLGPDGARLGKRHGSIGVSALRERGLSPERVVGLLAQTLGLVPDGEESSVQDLVSTFALARIPRTPTVIDPERL